MSRGRDRGPSPDPAPLPFSESAKLLAFDDALRERRGASSLVGVDEVGRGPLAGPVVAAAVILPSSPPSGLELVRDSKALTARRREALFPLIRSSALGFSVGWSLPGEVDEMNILRATLAAMRRALERLSVESRRGCLVLVDGNRPVPGLRARQEALPRADARSLCVASASVAAKVVRDRWMAVLDRAVPGYGLAKNKGYGTPDHFAAIERLGPSAVHRRTFLGRLREPSLFG